MESVLQKEIKRIPVRLRKLLHFGRVAREVVQRVGRPAVLVRLIRRCFGLRRGRRRRICASGSLGAF